MIYVKFFAIIFILFQLCHCDDNGIDQISDCSSSNQQKIRKLMENTNLFVVSTLDGQLVALDENNRGSILWSYLTNNEGLMSSTIGDYQFINNAVYYRLVPSLDGGLYKLCETHGILEPIPLNVDILLKSSFKLGDDLLMSGGKEVKTYAIDMNSGRLVYQCGLDDCSVFGRSDENQSSPVILVRHLRQKVRAVDPDTGKEKWNFNVAENSLQILSQPDLCSLEPEKDHSTSREFKFNIAEGLVRFEEKKDGSLVWFHKFDSPIVAAWRFNGGQLTKIDLFNNDDERGESLPAAYIGWHNEQFYVQNSESARENYREISRVPSNEHVSSGALMLPNEKEQNALSLVRRQRGYFIYPVNDEVIERYYNLSGREVYNSSASDESIDQIIIISLWHWWREILIISIIGAVLLNLILSYIKCHLRKHDILSKVCPNGLDCDGDEQKEEKSSKGLIPLITDGDEERNLSKGTNSVNGNSAGTGRSGSSDGSNEADKQMPFVSRYYCDFQPINCLGKGGFGVVFEARNKIDDCHYAIKRISLPLKKESREKVMREVKALAKLEHQGIVRYYNSWLEMPPAGWRDEIELSSLGCGLSQTPWSGDGSKMTNGITENVSKITSHRIRAIEGKSVTVGGITFCGDTGRFGMNEPSFSEELSRCNNSYDSYVEFGADSNENEKVDSGLNGDEDEVNESGRKKRDEIPRSYLYIQMQLCQRETLREWLGRASIREPPVIFDIFVQIVDAVDYVHSKGLMHRDLKPSNIFFAMDGCIKIGDFGLVTDITIGGAESGKNGPKFYGGHTKEVGTSLYMSPEQIRGISYSNKVDIFSLGVIFFEMLMPFDTEMERIKLLSLVRDQNFPTEFSEKYPNEHEFVSKLLHFEPEYRPVASDILVHPLFVMEEEEEKLTVPARRKTRSRSEIS